jgi:hypothetical protein
MRIVKIHAAKTHLSKLVEEASKGKDSHISAAHAAGCGRRQNEIEAQASLPVVDARSATIFHLGFTWPAALMSLEPGDYPFAPFM